MELGVFSLSKQFSFTSPSIRGYTYAWKNLAFALKLFFWK